jgi:ribosomal protein L37AE/L43A
MTHCRNSSKIWKNQKCHTVGTLPKSGKTKNDTLSEQFQNLEKHKMTHCRKSSKIWKNKKCHTVGTVPKSGKTKK